MHSKKRDRQAVTYHYDSCAYFSSPEEDLEVAQTRKLEYICQKLRLRFHDRLLDIGCGWGGLIIHAALHHGAQCVGITLSATQAEYARE